jgi:hypothetical protein
MITEQAIELVPSAACDDPTTRLARVNALYDNGEATDEQVELVEREVNRAERAARRERARADAAEATRVEAKNAQIASRLQALAQVRAQVPHELLGHLRALQSLHVEASQLTAVIYALLDKDSSTVDEVNAHAVALGLRPSARALDPDLLRMAVGILLAGPRSRPNTTCTRGAALPMDRLLAELRRETPPLAPAEKAAVCRLALDAYALATDGASPADWIRPIFAPPSFLAGTPSASRFQQAQALLAALLQNGENKP